MLAGLMVNLAVAVPVKSPVPVTTTVTVPALVKSSVASPSRS